MSGKSGMRNSGSGIAAPGGPAARSAAGVARHVRLGDVAEEVRENWSGPTADVPVVGLEHIEPDEIWLRKWEVNPDENTFSKAFRKGQLLFGRRRAYQKKLSLAPSDGICSGDITVIAAKSDKVVPSLLPFLLRTDKFFDYAIQGSAGSLSPRVKWAHLAKYEFDMPPMDEQKKLAELLWAANDLKESYKKAIAATDEMLKAKFREMFGDTAGNSKKWPMPKFGDSLNGIENGKSFVCQTVPREGDYPAVLKLSAVTYGVYQPNENKAVLDESQYNPKIEVRTGDLLMTRKNTLELVGACAYVHETTPRLMLPDIVFRLDVKECYDKQFLWALLSHPDQRRRIQGIAGGTNTSMVNISKERLCNLPMVVPPLSLQREFVAIADKAELAKANLKKSIAAIDQVMKGLING